MALTSGPLVGFKAETQRFVTIQCPKCEGTVRIDSRVQGFVRCNCGFQFVPDKPLLVER